MPLSGYTPATREIKLNGDNSFYVRGLSLVHMEVLIREHFPDLDGIWLLVQDAQKLNGDAIQNLIGVFLSQAPGLAANIIALGAGEGDGSDAQKLPIGKQFEALEAIFTLTFSEPGSVGKYLGVVARLLKMKPETLTNLVKPKAS